MIQILDTTLRDGSYVTNFQFTPKDTAFVAAALDDAGVPFIETGHGLGLNAGTREDMRSPYPDEAYLKACQDVVTNNRWGMFFIPGIGRMEDIELAAKYGMHFVRIGTNVTEAEQAEPFIRKAKELGMYVASNFMKTYAVSADEVGRLAAIAASHGSDIVCVVDSAGGMFSEDIDSYVHAIRDHTDVDIGFHGHNNMGLGIANALRAVELGCAVVDTSIRGLGRSSGNTVTEIFLLAMKRKGMDLGIDITRILDLAETIVDPLLKNYQQVDSIGIVSGYARFHSSFLGRIMDYAGSYQVDPRELIVRVSAVDKLNAPNELVKRMAIELAEERRTGPRQIHVSLPTDRREQDRSTDVGQQAAIMADEACSLAGKCNSVSVFNLVQAYRPNSTTLVSRVIYEGSGFIVGSAEIADVDSARRIAHAVDGKVEYILIDGDVKSPASKSVRDAAVATIKKSHKLFYSDLNVWSDAVVTLVTELAGENYGARCIEFIGRNALSQQLQLKFEGLGFPTRFPATFEEEEASQTGDVFIYCEPAAGRLPKQAAGTIAVDAIVGSFTENEVEHLHQQGIGVVRADMHLQIQSLLSTLVGVRTVMNQCRGTSKIKGIPIASGGIIASRGTIIVNSAQRPTKVFGVADGKGFLLQDDELKETVRDNLRKVENAIYTRSF